MPSTLSPILETPALLAPYESLRDLLATFGPESLREVRERAYRSFIEFGLPTTRDEEFRYVPLRVLSEVKFQPAYGAFVERDQIESLPLGKTDAITLTFVNGQFSPELSNENILPEGVFVGTLQEGFSEHEDLILSHLGNIVSLEGKLGSTNDERFAALNTAFLGEGAFVLVPKNLVLERPVHIVYLVEAAHGAIAVYPRTLIVLEEGAQAKIVESYLGLSGQSFTNSVTEIFVAESAILEHTKFQRETVEAIHIANLAVTQEAKSTFTSNVINFGAKIARNDLNVWLDGEQTETWLNGANVGFGQQIIDNHTRIDHAKPNCNSFEVYKSVLGDDSVGVFNGKIFVYEDAQKTDAKQTNQAILLSPNAVINTKPQLEIFADDVKCTHGATIGQLRDDALFYLRARGIPKAEAQGMLVYAFVGEVLDKITLPSVREELEALLQARLTEAHA